jgi:hypothetical protein
MPFDKNFFSQFKEIMDEEHKTFKTHQEATELPSAKCTHFGKVKAVKGGLRCQCGAGWSGAQINVLLDYFEKGGKI